ncbi:FAD-dependent oxidoreductase [Nocardia sp. NBC_01009]|uniref:FAD-dependent oxidoreductase n=1 Tax=Nocardia sp. NBC_01009 TaxID=2975996 RepID=UPI003863EE86|nr:FAD-dependent monooxygenase [Nocardia sp. NBC_01009]
MIGRAAIIGCGIGGASTALALAKIGARVEVYEASARSVEVGGWVTLGPAASTALDRLGLGEQVRHLGFPVVRVTTVDTITGRVNSFARNEPGHRWPSTHVWRRDLLAVLRDRLEDVGVCCHYNVRAVPADVAGDLVVGADGARSATRRMLGDLRKPTYTGQRICYGHHDLCAPGLPTGILHFWTHPDGVVGYAGNDRDGSFWFSRRNAESPNVALGRDAFLEPLRDTPIAGVLELSEVSDPIALHELEPEGIWHTTDTVLVGDAAHAVSPAAGRGATSAIEDAIVLAKAVRDKGSIVAGLDVYTATRRPIARATYRPRAGRPPTRVTAAELEL